MTVRNPLALLGFAALCVVAAVALILAGHTVPEWLAILPQVSLFGGAAVMAPDLHTALLAPSKAQEPPATPGATLGLDPAAVEPVTP